MATIYVQFSDSTDAEIMSYFSTPQDPTVWPNQGAIDVTDARYAAFFATLPAEARQYLPVP